MPVIALIVALALVASERLVHHKLGAIGTVGIVVLSVGVQTHDHTFTVIGAAAILAALIPQADK
ncbi:hypothetical protein [Streptomyces melanogenes]|uniref:hypothetical protein n=1 Tax=Streptomyces melanogenes TaxID=67326 RepID=UPI00378FFCF8